MKILCIIGTRPEAIKMAPVIRLLKKHNRFETEVCTTSQHKELLESALNIFGITSDYDLGVMQKNQNQFEVSINILRKIEPVILKSSPDLILVQGDTTTSFISALAAFYLKIPIGHVEAGLRTWRKTAPYPEEINRQMVSKLADIHFAPTLEAKQNLLSENISEAVIHVTGNTVVDSLKYALEYIESKGDYDRSVLFPEVPDALRTIIQNCTKKIIMVTVHRRENFGSGIDNICIALNKLAQREDVVVAFTIHPNPNVKKQVEEALVKSPNVFHLPPLDYLTFVFLMNSCYFIITDSGGIQEEAPYLGKPVLVTRELTERSESVKAGASKLVGTNTQDIFNEAIKLLDNEIEYKKMTSAFSPYGDGKAAEKIIGILENRFF
jgi:UDP-N-acetylglucosamine 2-epimerase (non-hydrolysing)